MDLVELINSIKKSKSFLWLEDDRIKLFMPDGVDRPDLKEAIKEHKYALHNLLIANKTFSRDDFEKKFAFKTTLTEAPLSFSQERLWFVEQYEGGTHANHIPLLYELARGVDKEAIKYAIQRLVMRHEVLRSTIEQRAEGALQIVQKESVPIDEIMVAYPENLNILIKSDINKPFNLSTEYPIRVRFYIESGKTGRVEESKRTLLLINFHHIASDGISTDVFLKEFREYYNAYSKGTLDGFELPLLEIQFKDYAAWQRLYLTDDVIQPQLKYWQNKLTGYEPLSLPTDYSRPARSDYHGLSQQCTIRKDISKTLRKLAQHCGTTLHNVLMASVNILLSKYTSQEDVVIGSPIANRHHQETEGLIGFFVNIQAHRTFLNKQESFRDLIHKTHNDQISAQRYQDLPFEKLVEALGVERDPSRHPIFQVLFSVENSVGQGHDDRQVSGLMTPLKLSGIYEVSKLDLSITVLDDGDGELTVVANYAKSLFNKETISGLLGYYQHLLEQLTSNPDISYGRLSLLNEVEYQRHIYDWNRTDTQYDNNSTIHVLFQEQAARTPNAIAVVFENTSLTYQELNEKSNQLARHLREQFVLWIGHEVTPDNLIGLYVDRGLEMIVGILAILKAGGAYIPIDINHPQTRVNYLIEDSATKIIFTQRGLPVKADIVVIHIDFDEQLYKKYDSSNLVDRASPNSLAYVIYTSGTTGNPKGVMVEHASVVNLVNAQHARFQLSEKSRVLQFASLVFDASVWEIFSTLTFGAQLFILPPSIRQDARLLLEYLELNKITHATIPPPMLGAMPYRTLAELKTLVVAGDLCAANVVEKWSERRQLINAYGPTETTVCATMHLFEKDHLNNSNIGRPLPNLRAYVLNKDLTPTPSGAIGDLFVSGAGVARGYLNLPALTQERFLSNPYALNYTTGARFDHNTLYKTGDLVRRMPDGSINYVGRNDEQVKIRGYRIELAETEYWLSQQQGVKQCYVMACELNNDEGTSKYLVGYYVKDISKVDLTESMILADLSKVLPEFMVPTVLIPLAYFPLNISGKIDKLALPRPDFSVSKFYVAPVNQTEQSLCEIWQKLLKVDRVGMNDNFFRIGGNSILAIQASHRMSWALGYDIKVADLFVCKTLSQLLKMKKGDFSKIFPSSGNDAPLSFSQERMWFVEHYEGGTNANHIPLLFELMPCIDKKGITYAIQKLIERHEVLRSTIEQNVEQEGALQVVHAEAILINEIIVSGLEDCRAHVKSDINRPFNLTTEYPVKVRFYIETDKAGIAEPARILLLINFHHIATDGWSTDIFLRELNAFYNAYIEGRSEGFELPALKIQYKDYAIWQRSYLTEGIIESQIKYWKDRLSGFETLSLPTDYTRPGKPDYHGQRQQCVLNKDLSIKLKELAQRYGTTLYSVLMASVNILLNKYTGQEDIVIGSPIANRHHEETEGLIGFFVNLQAHRAFLNKNQSFKDLIKQIHESQVSAQRHQDFPFEKLVEILNVERDTSRHPIFQVSFSVETMIGQASDQGSATQYMIPTELEGTYEISKFDLSITVIDKGAGDLIVDVMYATSLFRNDTISQLLGHFEYLLGQLAAAPEIIYNRVSLLDKAEYDQIVYDWNRTDTNYANDTTIYNLFQEQVVKSPDAVALVCDDQVLTYRELNEKSNQLARHIRQRYRSLTKRELQGDTLIALCLDRSLEMIVGIIAILKAGGAYVPIDPNYPQARVDYMLKDSSSEVVLTREMGEGQIRPHLPTEKVIYIDLNADLYKTENESNLDSCSGPSNLAYIIYTSGTTGRPKGVMIEHKSVLCRNNFYQHTYGACNTQVSIHYRSYCFDGAVCEYLIALLNGGKCIIYTVPFFDVASYIETIKQHGVNRLCMPPQLFYQLAEFDRSVFEKVKVLTVGGDKGDNAMFRRYNLEGQVFNAYGPTECTIDSHCFDIAFQESIPAGASCIGKNIFDNKSYVLDDNNQLIPVGVIGELHIAGAGLARGYLNNPEMTDERFVPNPYASQIDMERGYLKLYKTGDLVSYLRDGNVKYIGRNDDQVKIRGYRIELVEIEQALDAMPGIQKSCVIVKELKKGTEIVKELVAYVIKNAETTQLLPADILGKLAVVLPEYMVPGALVELPEFPLTFHGKLDKRLLPDPDFGSADGSYVHPETELEITMCRIYGKILGIPTDNISVDDSFFRMGGNSLLTLKLKLELTQLGEFKDLNVADLFKYKSIRNLIEGFRLKNKPKYKLQERRSAIETDEIAIIGYSGVFSGAENIDEFWQLIVNQREGSKFYSEQECKDLGVEEKLINQSGFISVAGKVKNIELFDPDFWNMSPNEARQLDPQIRKFIEHGWYVMEAAGYSNVRKDKNVGVFAGSGESSYFYDNVVNGSEAEVINFWEAKTSNSKDALATKVAFLLGLSGPATSVNTACSTSLVSIVEACKNLQLECCDVALAGGVTLTMPNQIGYVFQEGMIQSRDGHCRTFDKDASGTISGSGVGVVLLKRLKDAIRDGDRIFAVIKGYCTNNDGDRKTGYTAPSVLGQSECIINAQKMAGVTAGQIEYVECHGTATHLGDSIEIKALAEAFAYNSDPKTNASTRKTLLGAVKANIGHADSAAGVAGLIKVCEMLRHNTIPAQVNFEEANPELNLDKTSFVVPKQKSDWFATSGSLRFAGVSSFGIGGTNAHVIISDYTPVPLTNSENQCNPYDTYILPISAKSSKALESYKNALAKYLESVHENNFKSYIKDVAFTLSEKREHFSFRSAYGVTNRQQLIDSLKADKSFTRINAAHKNKIVFVFPGQGSQYNNMAADLYQNESQFRDIVDKCIDFANPYLSVNLGQIMYSSDESSSTEINRTEWTQIALFIVEYSLARYLEINGIKPDVYIGHSIGEFVAATLCGVFDLPDAIKIVIRRGQLMQSMPAGSMLAINATHEVASEFVQKHECQIAAFNSEDDIVVSGKDECIERLQSDLENSLIPFVRLNTSHAFHSSLMEEASARFAEAFSGIKFKKPSGKIVSNLSGEIAGEELVTAEYWQNQLRNTVQFAKGVDSIIGKLGQEITFVEVGPGKSMANLIKKSKKIAKQNSIHTVQLLPSAKQFISVDKSDSMVRNYESLLVILWTSGLTDQPNKKDVFKHAKLDSSLPVYQFDFQRCWIEKRKTDVKTNEIALLNSEQWLSTPVWIPGERLNKKNSTTLYAKNALFFARQDQLQSLDGSELAANMLIVAFDENAAAENFANADGLITINPRDEKAFAKLAAYIHASGFEFESIIHTASLDNGNVWQGSLSNSFYSLFLIRQYFLKGEHVRKLLVVTNGLSQITGQDMINPSNGALVGAIRNINHEFVSLDARIIDIGHSPVNLGGGLLQLAINPKYCKSEKPLAIRFEKIWCETLLRIEYEEVSQSSIENGDTILVTGGLGNIALSFVEQISHNHKVRFILVGRGKLDTNGTGNSKASIVQRVRANGSAVDVYQTDISSLEQVSTLTAELRNAGHKITWIVHTAGLGPMAIRDNTVQEVERAFEAKVIGIENIFSQLDMSELKGVVLTSSLASIMGDANRLAYCASNSYLDYLSIDKNRFGDLRIVSINWPGWRYETEVHTIVHERDELPAKRLERLMHLNTVSYSEGAETFLKILARYNEERVVLSKLDIERLTNALFNMPLLSSSETSNAIISPDNSTTEVAIAKIFAQILGVEHVSADDDFFKMGGTSIAAIQVSHKIRKSLGCDLKVADIFKYRTVSELVKNALNVSEKAIIKTKTRQSVLSFAQERLWFIEQFAVGTNAYHLPELFELKHDADIDALKSALISIVARHEVLRSTINDDDNKKGIQIIHDESPVIEDAIFYNEDEYSVCLQKDINHPFDLSKEYPIRIKFYKITPSVTDNPAHFGKIFLLINTHHIATDGWSGDIFRKELSMLYEARANNMADFSLPELEIQYKDFAIWQRNYLTGQVLESQLNYWRQKLSGYDKLIIPTDYKRPSEVDYKGAQISFKFGQEASEKLKFLAKLLGATPHSVMLAATNILLGKYTGQNDVVVGTANANRHHHQTEKLIGFFVNTQVVRTMMDHFQTFSELVLQIQKDQAEAQQYQDLPFERLVDGLQADRDPSRHPVFQVMFGVQGFNSRDAFLDERKLPLAPVNTGNLYRTEKFDLSFTIASNNHDELIGEISYATSLFKEETIYRLIDHYKILVTRLLAHPEKPYSKISLLSDAEYEKLLVECNNTREVYTRDKTIHQMFEEQVLRTPDQVALIFEGRELTYKEVNEKSNQLARHIRKQYRDRTGKELLADTPITLCLERSLEMVLAILAVMKAGGAYVPIDPSYPHERVAYLLQDTQSVIVLTQKHITERYPELLPGKMVVPVDLDESLYLQEQVHDLPCFSTPSNIAYVIYTSGTTGQPKGVMLHHAGILNRIEWMQSKYQLDGTDAVLHKTPYVFDVSVWELLWANWYGARIVIAKPDGHKDSDYLYQLIERSRITTLHFVPSMLDGYNHFLQEHNLEFGTSINQLFCSGEALSKNTVERTYANTSKRSLTLHNLYGPTEASVDVTYYETVSGTDVYIGKPIQNTQVYILDHYHNPVPVGVAGELYLGGAGLARGYLNRVELTHDRFVDNPFATAEDKANGYTRLYRTGDLVKWVADGNIEYIGRNDEQVKIRGYRIELDEVEHVLGKQAGVQQCCVLVKERNTPSGKTKYLVGYYVKSDSRAEITATGLLQLLGQSLPEYMVPSVLVELESFPLTINGKLDKQALPDPEHSLLEEYVTPVSEVEKKLCGIWQEVLGLERVGITDNFFRIGGDSILSIQLTSRIRQSGLPCQVKDIFECKTIGRLADQINKRTETVSIQSEQGLLAGYCDLLPIQSWFFDQIEKGSFLNYNHWNQSFLIKTPALELSRLQQISVDLANHHDVLRMRYLREQTPEGVRWKQVYQSTGVVPEIKVLCVQGLSASAIESTLTDWQSGFNLDQGPLFQLGYLYGYEDESCRIFFASHHLIVDGVSWRILNEDIRTLYSGKLLSSKGSSYRQWANTLAGYARHHRDEAAYWQRQLQDIPRYEVPERPGESWEEVSFELSSELTDTLLYQAPNSYHTEINDLLLTALAYALKDHNGSDLQGIMLEAHGRENIDSSIDITRTVGWFTSLFPVRLELQQDVGESIQFIKESLRHIPNKGIGFGVFDGNTSSKFSTENLPPITFNYLGQLDAQDGDWKIVGESSGLTSNPDDKVSDLIRINGMVFDSKLIFKIGTRAGHEYTAVLCDNFKSRLTDIIQHCLDQLDAKGGRYTPSDFGAVRISKDLLNRLQQLNEE